MKVGVMQPYFLPYLGYFQLIDSVDSFVFFDDVNFIKKGWINRNSILLNNEAHKFTIPLIKASQNKLINEIYLFDYLTWRNSFMSKIEVSYKSAPNYSNILDLIHDILYANNFELISDLSSSSVMKIMDYINLNRTTFKSSNLNYSSSNATGKIVSICKKMNATEYINPINGKFLYDSKEFNENNLEIKIIKMSNEISYSQNSPTFISNLSIIDVLMFNTIENVRSLIGKYEII